MTEAQAQHFLRRRAGQPVCVRYVARSSGQIRFRTAPPLLGAIAFLFAIGGCASLGLGQRWCFEASGDAHVCEVARPHRETAQGCPLPPPREALPNGGQRVRVDFTIDPDEEVMFVGLLVSDPARDHFERYPDRLEYQPTADVWRNFSRRLRERAEQRRQRRHRRRTPQADPP
jgi:hypothetical protein